MRERDAYRVAGAAMRDALDRARDVRPRLKAVDRAVLDAVLWHTASWSRLEDRVYVADIAAQSGYDERGVRRSLKRLDEVGVIEWVPVPGNSGRGRRSTVGLVASSAVTGDLDRRLNRATDSRSNRPSRSPKTEKSSEKSSEEWPPEDALDWVEAVGRAAGEAA